MKYHPGWSSHYPILVKIIMATKGPVLEAGMGIFSTPLLHWLCLDQDRELISLDSNEKYCNINRHFKTEKHKICLIKDWGKFNFSQNWDVVLVDNETEMRSHIIKQVANNANYIIAHDTDDKIYNYNEIFPLFRYRYDYNKCRPQTSVLSNKKDLSWLSSALQFRHEIFEIGKP